MHRGSPEPRSPDQYWNPYVAGIGLGLTLLLSFLIVGRGLGASGGFTTITASLSYMLNETYTTQSDVLQAHLSSGRPAPLRDWLVLELMAVFLGGFLSAKWAGRLKKEIVRGSEVRPQTRLLYAFSGGMVMGFAAKIARGCTSGQALSGGALLNAGSWIFMLAVFAGGFAAAWFVRRQWS